MKLGEYLKTQYDKFSKAQPWYVVDHVFYVMTDLPDFFVYNGDKAVNEMLDQLLSAVEKRLIKTSHLTIKFTKKDNGKKPSPYYYVMKHGDGKDVVIKTANVRALIKMIRYFITKSGEAKFVNQMTPSKKVYIGKRFVS